MPFLVLGVLAGCASAQGCPRPTPPPGGLPAGIDLFVPVTYSDGYQTMGTMIMPAGAPPVCGWPLVVFVHPYGQTRGFDQQLQQTLAGQGYAVWSYDVRAHGQAVALNPGHLHAGSTMWGPIERYDLAEQILFVAANPAWTGSVDAARVAVCGSSQGGAHAWQAAAWSGRAIAAPDRPGLTFPAIACVVAADLVADPADDWLRGGRLFSSWFVEAISGSYSGVSLDAAFAQTCRNAFLAQDPASLAAAFAAEQRGIGTNLATSLVPVLHSHAFFDHVASPLSAIVHGEARPAVHRVVLGTIGHGVPANVLERELRDALIERWLHRWLWNVPNEVDVEPRAVLAEVPLRQVERDDVTFRWNHTQAAALATPTSAARLHLHDDFVLRPVPPGAGQPAVVQQTVDPLATDFTAADYLAQPALRDVAAVLARCPLQERVWSYPVGDDSQLVRSPTVHLRVLPAGPHWLLAALLTIEAPGTGEEVLLGMNTLASLASVPGVAEEHDLRLPPVAARVPLGATLRLRLRNLPLRSPPMAAVLDSAPIFHDFRVDVGQSMPHPSWLDLPLEPLRPRLVVDRAVMELAAPAPVVATVRGGSTRANFPYFVTVGISGQLPGTAFLNDWIPIEADWLVLASAGSSQVPYFTGFLGFLDATGSADATLALGSAAPLPQLLNSLSLTFAAFVWDGAWAASGAAAPPCEVLLR